MKSNTYLFEHESLEKYIEFKYNNKYYVINKESTCVYGGRLYDPHLLLSPENEDEIYNYYIQQERINKLNRIIDEY